MTSPEKSRRPVIPTAPTMSGATESRNFGNTKSTPTPGASREKLKEILRQLEADTAALRTRPELKGL